MSSIASSSEPPGGDLGKGMLAGQHLEQDQPERVDVGALVDGLGSGRAAGIERVEMLGRHVRKRAAHEGAADLGLGRLRQSLDGEIEIEQHRRSVAGQQNIRGLQIAVEQSARMGVLEAVGQPGHDPDRGLNRRGTVQKLARRLVVVALLALRACAAGTARGPTQRENSDRNRDAAVALRRAGRRGCKAGPG